MLIEQHRSGQAPDSALWGINHMAGFGIEALTSGPFLAAGALRRHGLPSSVVNLVNQAVTGIRLPRVDVVFSTVAGVLPRLARLRSAARVFLLNVDFCTALGRLTGLRRAGLVRALGSSTAIICFAQAQRQRLLSLTSYPEEKVLVVHAGADCTFYRPAPFEPNGPVLAVGQDSARDYATFCKAMATLPLKGIIVAAKKNLDGVEVPANISVRLGVSFLELRELYRQASCIVVPSKDESFSYGSDCSGLTVLLDAMASARPLIASDRQAHDEYIGDGVAVRVPPGDDQALRAAIEKLNSEPALGESMGSAGRERVEQRFTSLHFAGELAKTFRWKG